MGLIWIPFVRAAEVPNAPSAVSETGAEPSVSDIPILTKGDFQYQKSNGEITITRYSPDEFSVVSLVIPDEIDGLKVTTIGEKAFIKCEKLTIRTPAGAYAEKYAEKNLMDVNTVD